MKNLSEKGAIPEDPDITKQTLFRLLEQSGIATFDLNLKTGQSVVSKTWKTMLGLDADEEIQPQRHFRASVHSEDLESIDLVDRDLMSGAIDESNCVFRIRHKMGHWIWVRSEVEIVERDLQGRPLRLAGVHTEVTSQMQVRERGQRESVENFAILNSSPAGAVILNRRGRIVDCNQVFCEVLDYQRDELIGQKYNGVVRLGENKDTLRQLRKILKGDVSESHFECQCVRRDGASIQTKVSCIRLTDEALGPVLLLQLVDVSNLAHVEQQSQDFLGNINHELRTPLTSILSSLKLANSGQLGDLPVRAQKLLKNAEIACDRLHQRLDALLEFQSLQSEDLEFDVESLNAAQFVASVCEHSTADLKPDQHLVVRINPNAKHATIVVDGGKLQRILHNLLSNASKFSPEGAKIQLRLTLVDNYLRFYISDVGPGVPEQIKRWVFEPFAQADSSDTRTFGGLGLGLALAKRLTQGMGGKIGCKSNAIQGSTFWVAFPIETAAEDFSPASPLSKLA